MNPIKSTLILTISLLTGCMATNSTSFKSMSTAYREVIEQYSNDNILLNVVRASDNMPLSFLDIPSVVGTGNVISTASLSSNVVSASPSSIAGFFSATNSRNIPSMATGSLGMTVNNGFTFTQSSLDNNTFMMSFLKDIPIDVIEIKGTERLRPKLVEYMLLVESIELQNKDGSEEVRMINDPMDPTHPEFQQMLIMLIKSGLKIDKRVVKIPISAPMSESNFAAYSKSWGDSIVNHIVNGSLIVDKSTHKGQTLYQLVKINRNSQFCINKHLADKFFGPIFNETIYCQSSPKNEFVHENPEGKLVLNKSNRKDLKDLNLVLNIRSVGNIFDYLGSVMLLDSQESGKSIMIPPTSTLLQSYYPGYQVAMPLFRVYQNAPEIKATTSVTYKGNTYSIAENDGSYSKIVMEYLSTLLSITKIPGAIPASPAVLVR